jgi:uncharacterized protein (TIGR03067 family)
MLPLAVLILPLLGSESPRVFNDKTEIVSIEGTWRQTAVKLDGQDRPHTDEVLLIFRSAKYEWIGLGFPCAGTYHIDATKSPARLDMRSTRVPHSEYIFRLEGDTLLLAFQVFGTNLPKGFDGDNSCVETFKRVGK